MVRRSMIVKLGYGSQFAWLCRWLGMGLANLLPIWLGTAIPGWAATAATVPGCPYPPISERLQRHVVRSGESLGKIASRYQLSPATLMGFNPAARTGVVNPGQTLTIPPYNGVLVPVTAGETLAVLAQRYRVRTDVLFEMNGCQKSLRSVFIPGAIWSPQGVAITVVPSARAIEQVERNLSQDRYPLPQSAPLRQPYGWQPQGKVQGTAQGTDSKLRFSSGVVLAAVGGTLVSTVADGSVTFAGLQAPWGQMVIVNHAQGRQTRYGYLQGLTVQVGQRVRRGQVIAQVSKATAALRFELRYRAAGGWVAQNPQPYLEAILPRP
jgi:murein DD-endopeptidase MepM/ murein hydrolase activator NlpD